MSNEKEINKARSPQKALEKFSNKRSPNWSDGEIRALCTFVKEHKEKLFGLGEEANKKGVNAAKKQHWELAAALINERCSTNRHWSQVRKKWKDLSYLYARNASRKQLQSKSHCKIIQEELANVDEQTIKLTDVSSLSGSDSNSSNEGRTSAIVCCVSSANETNFSDISVKAEILDENHLNTSKISPATAAVTQGSTGFEKRVSDSWNERKRVECCSCFHTENCHGLNSKFNSLLEAILAKQLQSDSSNNKTTMTAYEKARLQLERDKYALQEKTAKCLRDISKEIRQIRASFSRVKRRRTNGHNAISHKRQRWRCESDSSV